MEIRVTEVNASDEITIRTQFGDYSFRVTDPVQCRGYLSGGPLGDQQHDAFFAGTILSASTPTTEPTRLETGYRAIFLIAGNGCNKLITSIITELNLFETPADFC